MAAILTQGRRFNLSSVPSNKNSSVLYVKLTDSSLKAIEEYQQAKNLKRKASISFSETIGVVSFPQKDAETPRTFDFTIQPSQNDDCFQCIKQSKANGASNLELLGVLSQKLTIQAGDDVYESTLKKMSIVEEQSKKPRTKEIKSSGPNNGNRLRKILRNVARNSQNPSSARSSRSQAASGPAQRKQATASIHAQPRVTPASRAALSSSPNGRVSPFPTTSKEKNGAVVAVVTSVVVTAAMGFALRDRIIHLLAIKNYKKPELLLKLQFDGLSDKDKDLFMPTLEQVAQVNPRDSSYSLQRHLYTNEVKHEWPLYSDSDRQQLSKKLSLLSLNPPLNPRTISPCPSNGSQGSPPRTKRSSDLVDLAPKRLTEVQEGSGAWSGSASKRPNDAGDNAPPPKKVRVAHNAKRERARPASGAQSSVQNGLPSQGYPLQAGSTTSGVSPSSDLTEDLADTSCDPEDDDFKRTFTTIHSYEQRCRYKMEFNKGHKEHQEVYDRISNKVAHIVELQAQIMQETEGTARYDVLRNEIYEEYFRLKNDSDYVKDRNRYEYLVKKLVHIKQLVYTFDHDHPATK